MEANGPRPVPQQQVTGRGPVQGKEQGEAQAGFSRMRSWNSPEGWGPGPGSEPGHDLPCVPAPSRQGLEEPQTRASVTATRRFWEQRRLPWKHIKAGTGAGQRWDLDSCGLLLSYPHQSHLPNHSALRWWPLSSRTHPSQPQDPLTSPFPRFLPTLSGVAFLASCLEGTIPPRTLLQLAPVP